MSAKLLFAHSTSHLLFVIITGFMFFQQLMKVILTVVLALFGR